jgi:hypothetical protein
MNKFIYSLMPIYFGVYFCFLTGCAYRQGTPDRSMPGGYRWVKVPIFKNYTQEPGIELSFTNALIEEVQRSRVAQVVEDSDISIEGVIEDVNYRLGGKRTSSDYALLPEGAVQATEYRILILARISVIRGSDQKVLWTGQFNGERTYTAPQIASAVVNTANPLYNLSARRLNIKEVASDIATEAFDRMTENF